MNDFHGLEEYMGKPDYSVLYQQTLDEMEQERNGHIRSVIRGLLGEKKGYESEIKALQGKLKKVEGRLLGYSSGQVNAAGE